MAYLDDFKKEYEIKIARCISRENEILDALSNPDFSSANVDTFQKEILPLQKNLRAVRNDKTFFEEFLKKADEASELISELTQTKKEMLGVGLDIKEINLLINRAAMALDSLKKSE